MTLPFSVVPGIAENVTTRMLSGEAFIMHLQTGKTFALNETGSFIWFSIDGDRSISDIAGCVCDEYEITPEDARAAVADLVERLSAENLLTVTQSNE